MIGENTLFGNILTYMQNTEYFKYNNVMDVKYGLKSLEM